MSPISDEVMTEKFRVGTKKAGRCNMASTGG